MSYDDLRFTWHFSFERHDIKSTRSWTGRQRFSQSFSVKPMFKTPLNRPLNRVAYSYVLHAPIAFNDQTVNTRPNLNEI